MKYFRITKPVFTSSGFVATSFQSGEEFKYQEHPSLKEKDYTSLKVNDRFFLIPNDSFEVFERELVELKYNLYIDGIQTSHYFPLYSIPDIRELGYDLNSNHSFQITSVIT